jgi:hypothetical protein
MAKYRKKPVVIEAVQWTGQNFGEIHMLNHDITGAPQDSHALYIPTLEGVMRADLGDWIIKAIGRSGARLRGRALRCGVGNGDGRRTGEMSDLRRGAALPH